MTRYEYTSCEKNNAKVKQLETMRDLLNQGAKCHFPAVVEYYKGGENPRMHEIAADLENPAKCKSIFAMLVNAGTSDPLDNYCKEHSTFSGYLASGIKPVDAESIPTEARTEANHNWALQVDVMQALASDYQGMIKLATDLGLSGQNSEL